MRYDLALVICYELYDIITCKFMKDTAKDTRHECDQEGEKTYFKLLEREHFYISKMC